MRARPWPSSFNRLMKQSTRMLPQASKSIHTYARFFLGEEEEEKLHFAQLVLQPARKQIRVMRKYSDARRRMAHESSHSNCPTYSLARRDSFKIKAPHKEEAGSCWPPSIKTAATVGSQLSYRLPFCRPQRSVGSRGLCKPRSLQATCAGGVWSGLLSSTMVCSCDKRV